MSSAFETFNKLRSYIYFFRAFRTRLGEVNDKSYLQFVPGPDLDFVHHEWRKCLEDKEYLLTEDILTLFIQDALGELCHGLARYETVLVTGQGSVDRISDEERKEIELIAKYKCAYFALDFCASIYREIMPFRTEQYTTKRFDLHRACKEIDQDPLQGRYFVKLLRYPDKTIIVN